MEQHRLPPIKVNENVDPLYLNFGLRGHYALSSIHPWSFIPAYVERRLAAAVEWLIDTTESSKAGFAADYANQLQLLPSTIQSEINATIAAVGATLDSSLTASITRELNAVRQLIHQRNLALPQFQSQANLFFSGDPLTKSRQNFINTIGKRDLAGTPPAW